MNLKLLNTLLKLGALIVLPVFLFSCSKGEQKAEAPLSDLAKKGKGVYMANCIVCHNPDPKIAGSIGPDIAWSSEELIRERVMRRAYPAGYTPKRKSDQMPDFPQLEGDIPALAAYLNSFTK